MQKDIRWRLRSAQDIERFCEQEDKDGGKYGDKSALQREHIVKMMATRADKPESANGLRKALRAMMENAVATAG
jgi:hypothetical protein